MTDSFRYRVRPFPPPITSTISLGIITTEKYSTSIAHGRINETVTPDAWQRRPTRRHVLSLARSLRDSRTVAKIKNYLDVPQGTVQDTKVGRLFLILGDRQLPLQEFEAFL